MIDDAPELPKVHKREERKDRSLFRVETLDLEFSNGERRVYEMAMQLLVQELAVAQSLDEETVQAQVEQLLG